MTQRNLSAIDTQKTSATGTNWVPLNSHACTKVIIVNPTATATIIRVRNSQNSAVYNAASNGFPINSSDPPNALTVIVQQNANELEFRRDDHSNSQVEIAFKCEFERPS